jgi:hypothetical protein
MSNPEFTQAHADNLDDFEDTRINTSIDAISAISIASTSKNSNYDGMIAFRAPSSA